MCCASSWPIATAGCRPTSRAEGTRASPGSNASGRSGGGKEVLAFLLDDAVAWRAEYREEDAIVKAVHEGRATPGLLAEAQAKVRGLQNLKKWLNGRAITARFTTPEDLRGKIEGALHGWRQRHRNTLRGKHRNRKR
jgi:hypothetical protein